MNIKSILLGSAAALVAVSGARAADAVVMVEPEPVEYVRVCDVYGTGFFYIPGTETCMRIGGYVRARFGGSDGNLRAFDPDENGFFDDDGFEDGLDDTTFGSRVRVRLNVDVREETELGTLRAVARLQAENNGFGDTFDDVSAGSGSTGDAGFGMDQGFIQLGGLTVGYLDSLWTHDDGGISDGLLTDENDWAAGDIQANRISYTYAANGFSGTLSVEDDNDGDFVPDVLGKLAYVGGFGGAYLMGVYDEDSGAFLNEADVVFNNILFPGLGFITEDFEGSDEEAFVVKAGIQLENLIAEDSVFKIEGHYAFDPSIYASVGTLNAGFGNGVSLFDFAAIPSEYQIGAGYSQEFGDLLLAVSGVYGETFEVEAPNFADFDLDGDLDALEIGSAEYFAVAANVGYDITSNFSVLGELSYRDYSFDDSDDDFDQTQGLITFQRNF